MPSRGLAMSNRHLWPVRESDHIVVVKPNTKTGVRRRPVRVRLREETVKVVGQPCVQSWVRYVHIIWRVDSARLSGFSLFCVNSHRTMNGVSSSVRVDRSNGTIKKENP